MRKRILCIGCCFGLLAACPVWGQQRINIPNNSGHTTYQQGSATRNPLSPVPQLGASERGAPSTTLGQPSFDPYSTDPNAASQPPSLLSQPNAAPDTNAPTTPFWQAPPATTSPQGTVPGSQPPRPTYPPGTFPQQPAVLFPNGMNLPKWTVGNAQPGPYLRLFQDIRMTYTWLRGDDSPDEMDTNDVQLGTTVNFPNFFFSGYPLHVSPEFIFHFWDGPQTNLPPTAPGAPPAMPLMTGPGTFPTELPSRVYSTYLRSRWQPMFTPSFGGDIEFNVGVYSDFDTVTSDSLRFSGTGLLVLALTPTVSLKGGVTFLDRVDLKLLPAAGILWRPNPQTRFDIYFPTPKLAQYLYTVGNTDVWWYVNGEIGGGSWTIDRGVVVAAAPGPMVPPGATTIAATGGDRRVDINDIRIGGGLEWTHQFGLKGFVEVAYVFDREIVFASGPPMSHKLDDTIMLRGGLAY